MVDAGDAVLIYQSLTANGAVVWVVGGWGIDALLGQQTRPHKDLDVIIRVDDVRMSRELLERDGYREKENWPENVWVDDKDGCRVATAFVLVDPAGREVDIHAMHVDDDGRGLPAWGWDGILEREDLAGEGSIGGVRVRCFSPEVQLVHHAGYELPEVQIRDVELLRERFDLA